tara:strand:- start:91 stop:1341 length:1251 start_codon:yes stop_codon:yes gene_type:complete
MDEEQPQKKITLSNFFEQIVEVNKVANAALTNSNNLRSQLNAVQLDLKRLVESLQVNFDSGVKNVQTQINEVTNVIVDDQRIKQSETDALEQQIFAQEDQLQKQVKGQKAKPTSSDGNLLQRTTSSIQNKAKSNLLAAGLFGSSFLLAGIKGKRPESDYEKNRKRNRPEVKSDGNFFTNFFKRNDSKEENKKEVIEKKIEEVQKIEKKNAAIDKQVDSYVKERKVPINKDLTIDKSMVNNNVIQKIVEKKKPDLVTSNNEEFNKRKRQLINRLKYDPREVVAAAKKSYEEGGTGMAGYNEETGKIEVTSKEELQAHKEAVLSTKAGKQPGGGYSTYAANTVYSQFMGFDDGPVSKNNVVDGGTTIIEGDNEVVNENVNSGQSRGEVIVDTEIVKSSNSPIASIAIAEGNSLNNLAI